jgi:hypothetical protein
MHQTFLLETSRCIGLEVFPTTVSVGRVSLRSKRRRWTAILTAGGTRVADSERELPF